ncbi:MAG TPA: TonB-dependent receptor [Burkholderiaceae bacterium]|nr:TonB-dependent receptor [Burkholderiaceae bacterium]
MRQVPATLGTLLLATASTTATHVFAQTAQAPASAASAAAPAPAPAPAKPEVQQLETITITTGTRSAKAVDKIPGAITVVGKEEVQHTLAVTEDATAVLARTVPGYSESSQAMSNTGENLRGRIALRLFDGIPQGSPLREGTRNGTFTDMGIISRIEVINGPSASEGIGAAGGIINYISAVPNTPGNQFTLTTRYTTQFHDDSGGWKLGGLFAHKDDAWDLIAAASHIERGMTYDGNGRRIGLNTSGSVADSKSDNIFVKTGFNFGEGREQRLQVSLSSFKIKGNGNYHLVDGDRTAGITNTSEKPGLQGSLAEINDFQQSSVSYSHENLFGGVLTLNAYYADQAMRYPPENGDDRQDPLIAPLGTLWDQSEIRSRKKGLRSSYAHQDSFGLRGLELRGGLDLTEDKADQRLALTDRLWVPPMLYKSTAPWLQVSYDIGPVTVSGGYRRESGTLHVDSYTTTYYRNRVFVEGGDLDYHADLPNLGLVWKLPAGWSVFAATSKGFTLPNVGIPLRNINYPGQSVAGIVDLQAVIVKNNEVGVNWRGARGSFSASYYESKSKFGQSLSIDPVTNDFLLQRVPVNIKGFEASGELILDKQWKASALYSHITGKTWFVKDGPLDKDLGVLDINPDKIGLSATWKPTAQLDMTLGSTTLLSRDLNEGTSSEEHTKGYTLLDFGANYDMGRYGKLTLGIENVTNRFYILSWSQVAGFRNYWSGRGRVWSIAHTITF